MESKKNRLRFPIRINGIGEKGLREDERGLTELSFSLMTW